MKNMIKHREPSRPNVKSSQNLVNCDKISSCVTISSYDIKVQLSMLSLFSFFSFLIGSIVVFYIIDIMFYKNVLILMMRVLSCSSSLLYCTENKSNKNKPKKNSRRMRRDVMMQVSQCRFVCT